MGLNEAETRVQLIDPAIHAQGWTEDLIRREETLGTVEIVDGLSDIKVGKKTPLTVDRFEEFFRLLPERADSEHSWTIDREEIERQGYALKAVNPNARSNEDTRTPEELLEIIESRGREVDAAIAELRRLLWTLPQNNAR